MGASCGRARGCGDMKALGLETAGAATRSAAHAHAEACERPLAVEETSAVDIFNRSQNSPLRLLIVDLRSPEEFMASHAAGSVNLPIPISARVEGPATEDTLALVDSMVRDRFVDVILQSESLHHFTIGFACSADRAPHTETSAMTLFDSAADRLLPFVATRALSFQYEDFALRFPFCCSDHPTFMDARMFPNWVAENLYLSSLAPALDEVIVRSSLNCTHVVNCTPDKPCAFQEQGVQYFRVAVKDDQSADISAFLHNACDFIDDALNVGGVVLVHCKHGRSRSVTVVVAWLMKSRRWSRDESLAYLEKHRPHVAPNYGFMQQLDHFESLLARA